MPIWSRHREEKHGHSGACSDHYYVGMHNPVASYLVTVRRYPTGILFLVPFYALIYVGAIRVFWPRIRKNPRDDRAP